ncbi:MAG: hypothetical protein ABI625_22350 [bacterium]
MSMTSDPLDLASARWRGLLQAYGSAEDIPRLVEALATIDDEGQRAELWFGAWATLCPEGRVYTAAYAVVPHLLALTEAQGAADRVAAIHIAAEVETLRHVSGAPPIPDDLVHSYAAAIESLPAKVAELSSVPWDAAIAQVMAAALLAGKRQPALARAILKIDQE